MRNKFLIFTSYRSSHQRCSIRKGVFRNFAKFAEKRLYQNLFFDKVNVDFCEFYKISKNTLFTEHLWATVSVPKQCLVLRAAISKLSMKNKFIFKGSSGFQNNFLYIDIYFANIRFYMSYQTDSKGGIYQQDKICYYERFLMNS